MLSERLANNKKMPKDITGTAQPTASLDFTITIPVTGDRTSASRMEAILQELVNNDATLKALIDSLNFTTGTGLAGAAAGIGIGTINVSIADAGVGAQQLADDAVTAAKIIASAVTTAKLADGAVTTVKLADDSVTAAKLNDAAVLTAALNDAAVTTAKLNDAAVTTAKLADDSVTADKIADDAVGISQLNASGTGTVGQSLVVAASNQIGFRTGGTNTRGRLIATSAAIIANGVGQWTLAPGIPSSIKAVATNSNPAVAGVPYMGFPALRPFPNMNGLWIVLRNEHSVNIDEFFVPYNVLNRVDGAGFRLQTFGKLVPSGVYHWGYKTTSLNYSDSFRIAVVTGAGVTHGFISIPTNYSVQIFAAVI